MHTSMPLTIWSTCRVLCSCGIHNVHILKDRKFLPEHQCPVCDLSEGLWRIGSAESGPVCSVPFIKCITLLKIKGSSRVFTANHFPSTRYHSLQCSLDLCHITSHFNNINCPALEPCCRLSRIFCPKFRHEHCCATEVAAHLKDLCSYQMGLPWSKNICSTDWVHVTSPSFWWEFLVIYR